MWEWSRPMKEDITYVASSLIGWDDSHMTCFGLWENVLNQWQILFFCQHFMWSPQCQWKPLTHMCEFIASVLLKVLAKTKWSKTKFIVYSMGYMLQCMILFQTFCCHSNHSTSFFVCFYCISQITNSLVLSEINCKTFTLYGLYVVMYDSISDILLSFKSFHLTFCMFLLHITNH